MANHTSEIGSQYTVFILAIKGTDSEGNDVVQEFGVQALIMSHVANGLLIGDNTLARIGAALYVAESTLTLFQGAFTARATRWATVNAPN
jgi:hypothetical protein